jgi:hypothetical protein
MQDVYTFRRCERSNTSELSNLVNQVLGTNTNSDYWEWKYFKNPVGRAFSTLALINGKIVGQLGAIPARFSVGGREVIGAQEVDAAILEDHRRFDVFLHMIALGKKFYLNANVEFSFGFSNEHTTEIGQALLQKKKFGPIPRLVKVLDIGPLLRQRFSMNTLSRILSPAGNIMLRIIHSEKITIPEGMQIERVNRFDGRFDTFWNRIKEDYPVMMVRDSTYLNWRYVDAPHVNYEIFCLEKIGSNEIIGFMVLGEEQNDYLTGQIFDIVTPRDVYDTITSCLLRFALNRFRKKKAAKVNCWMFSHCHVYPELTKMGFIPREKKGRDFLFQSINLQDPEISPELLENRENWYVTKGDSDY